MRAGATENKPEDAIAGCRETCGAGIKIVVSIMNSGELQEYLAEHFLEGWGGGKGKVLIPDDSYIDGYPYQISSLPKLVKKSITNPAKIKLELPLFGNGIYTAFDLTEFGEEQLKRYHGRKREPLPEAAFP